MKKLVLVALLMVSQTLVYSADELPLEQVTLPEGFTIDVYASDIPFAREMVLSPSGTLFVGSRNFGKKEGTNVYAVIDTDQDQKADEVFIIASNLLSPNGVAFHNDALYVAQQNQILRFDDIETKLKNPPEPVVVAEVPGEPAHGWKFIAFGPDGKLYVPVGAPCNICNRRNDDPRFATVLRMNPDGSDVEIVAHGVRNSVGFDWHPVTEEFWFTSNGRDMLGDNLPPDTLNRVSTVGMDFGFPFCHAGDLPDPEFGHIHPCGDFTPPAQKLGPHVASLGMTFYTGAMFPSKYRNQIFIAEHGSWNRSQKIGYRVTLVQLDMNSEAISYEPFAEGWLNGQDNWGRPVDVLVMPDGALLVSDDQTGTIYRISYARGNS